MTAKSEAPPAPTGAPPAPTGSDLAPIQPATLNGQALAIPDSAVEFLAKRQGQGFEGARMVDMVMPRVNILQSLSPQLKSSKPEFVQGAKEGQIFNAATQTVLDTIEVLPCHYIRHHLEWKPNRGGLVADHGEAGAALLERCRRNEQNYDVLPNGNLLVPTGTWYCIDLATGKQIIIPMARTQLKPSRNWMSMATSEIIRHPTEGEFTPPMFFRSYKLGSIERHEEENDWYVFTVERGPTIFELDRPELLAKATKFRDMLVSGEIKADAASFGDGDEDVGGRGGGTGSM